MSGPRTNAEATALVALTKTKRGLFITTALVDGEPHGHVDAPHLIQLAGRAT